MKQFKNKDWLRVIAGHERPINSVFQIKSCLTRYKLSDVELWQPKKGEWCWFYDKTSSVVPILAQFDYMSEHIYVTTDIKIPFRGDERSAYGFNSCIPFIGQLPKILKD